MPVFENNDDLKLCQMNVPFAGIAPTPPFTEQPSTRYLRIWDTQELVAGDGCQVQTTNAERLLDA
ncbi:hypothetical protein ACFOY8_11900 [Thalassospira xianhensis]|uniref:Uncharacterized protein n=1 Tax=Thalassospira xianhensis MCCC 1A02616 TaxID=1177929 RepID=A0A367U7D9_9PROT|nr:hypothetical protein [Thalassospira xianhensis]RCK04138.1 hypothetical protein TH5_21385 [Thalassospira xianhensis MCCC 1A02616]